MTEPQNSFQSVHQQQPNHELEGIRLRDKYMSEQKIDKQFRRKLRTQTGMIDHQKQNVTNNSGKNVEGSYNNGYDTGFTGPTNALSPTEERLFSGNVKSEARQSDLRKQYLKNMATATDPRPVRRDLQYYDDNIENDTEVFYQGDEDSVVLSKKHYIKSQEKSKKRHLDDNEMFEMLASHHREIDLVLQSNFDDSTKQKMIEEIQAKFRYLREEQRRRKQPTELGMQQKVTKKQLEHDRTKYLSDKHLQANSTPNRHINSHQNLNRPQYMVQRTRHLNYEIPQKGMTIKQPNAEHAHIDAQNKQFLMPEVTALVGQSTRIDKLQTRPKGLKPRSKMHSGSPSSPLFKEPHLYTKRTFGNKYCGYCIKDELSHPHEHKRQVSANPKKFYDSTMSSQHPKRKIPGMDSEEESMPKRMQAFTPGRIRASQKFRDPKKPTTQPEKDHPYNNKLNTQPIRTDQQFLENVKMAQNNESLFDDQKDQKTLQPLFGTAHFPEGAGELEDKKNRIAPNKKKDHEIGSSEKHKRVEPSGDENSMSWEEYLRHQQVKFKKLYGKKLIVEDDYQIPQRSSFRSGEKAKRTESGDSRGKTLSSNKHNQSSKKFIVVQRGVSPDRAADQEDQQPPKNIQKPHEPNSQLRNQDRIQSRSASEEGSNDPNHLRYRNVQHQFPATGDATKLARNSLNITEDKSRQFTSSIRTKLGEQPSGIEQQSNILIMQDHGIISGGPSSNFPKNQSPITEMVIQAYNHPDQQKQDVYATDLTDPPQVGVDSHSRNDTRDNQIERSQKSRERNQKAVKSNDTMRTNLVTNQNLKIESLYVSAQLPKEYEDVSSNSFNFKMQADSPTNIKVPHSEIEFTPIAYDGMQRVSTEDQIGSKSIRKRGKSTIDNAISNNTIGKTSKGKYRRVNADSASHSRGRDHIQRAVSANKPGFSLDRSGKSQDSHSPTLHLMEELTNGKVRIHPNTKLLINGTEILSNQGISGKINQVGIGFGTGRHLQGRKSHVVDRQEVVLKSAKPTKDKIKDKTRKSKSPNRPERTTVSVGLQTKVKQKNKGLSPKSNNLRSEAISPKTQTEKSRYSIGLSAKDQTNKSMRDQNEQVSHGRFDPSTIDDQAQTSANLLAQYLKRPQRHRETATDPITIVDGRPLLKSTMIQTNPEVAENDLTEPIPLFLPEEPQTRAVRSGDQDENQSEHSEAYSQLSEPCEEPPFILQLPNAQEAEEDQITEDWGESGLFNLIKDLNHGILVRKGLIDSSQVQRQDQAQLNADLSLEDMLNMNLNPDGVRILSYLDCDYGQALLKKKKMKDDFETLSLLYEDAKTTIIKLTENMIKPDVSLAIFFKHYQEINRKNVIKLLLRGKRLYDARNQMVNILVYVLQIDALLAPQNVLWRVLQDSTPIKRKNNTDMVNRTLRFLSTALTKISAFQQEHKLFSGEFKFNNQNQVELILRIGAILGGYLLNKRQTHPSLKPNGLLLEDREDEAHLKQTYKEWLDATISDKMDLPTEEEVDHWLPEETVQKEFQDSRVAKALKAIPAVDPPIKQTKVDATANVSDEEEFYRLDSHRIMEEGKTLISDQNIERTKMIERKRESLLMQNQAKQPEEEEKLATLEKTKVLKQQIKGDKELTNEMKPIKTRNGVQQSAQHDSLDPLVRHESELSLQDPLVLHSQNDFENDASTVQMGVRGSQIAYEGRSQTAFGTRINNNQLADNKTQTSGTVQNSSKILVVKHNTKPMHLQPRMMVSERTHLIASAEYATRPQNPVSEASEFTYMAGASQRIVRESKNFKDEDTDRNDVRRSQAVSDDEAFIRVSEMSSQQQLRHEGRSLDQREMASNPETQRRQYV